MTMIPILQEAALLGGEILHSFFRKNYVTTQKTSHQNLVTEADIKSQKAIKDFLEKEVSKRLGTSKEDIGFIGEEKLYKKGKITFVIDPLDGTSNFATGFEYYAVIIGVLTDDILTHGLIYMPEKNVMFYAEKGKGTFRKEGNEIRQVFMKKQDLKKVYLSGGFSNSDELRKLQMQMYDKLFSHFRGFLSVYSGAASVGELLDGVFGVYFHGGPKIWDIAGSKLLVEEAGGVVVSWYGKPFDFDLENIEKPYPAIYCHPGNLKEILEFMR
ncbi:MAG: inositol monophosphatase family protein [bacterium]|nr:inositol monophosphatase family protein [bacterium]